MPEKSQKTVQSVSIRFAGDSGDGMQMTGGRFTDSTALAGNDLSTLPDFPAEIRAPAGTLFGVSGFQINFSSGPVHTPGEILDVLVAMNPAALKTNLPNLRHNGIIIANSDAFHKRNLSLAVYETNPLEDGSLEGFQLFSVPITTLTREALVEFELTVKEKDQCKNFFALGITYWMYTRSLDITIDWIQKRFQDQPQIAAANIAALKAGYSYALSTEIFTTSYRVTRAAKKPGKYRNLTGNEALSLGLIAAAQKAGKMLFLGSYPITPASDILHFLSRHRHYDVVTFQAEDEMAGIGAALGASYAGAIGATSTSGPGFSLKMEFLGLAVMVELPLIVIDIQRSGPSTGMPTKTEQADLLQAMYGRNSEGPLPVIAPRSPADCFDVAYEAVRIALKFNTAVIILSDGYLANGAEPWLIPDVRELPALEITYADNLATYRPYHRDPQTLARTLALPGMAGFEHHIGGLEKDDSGNISYDAENHHRMVQLRAEKVARIADFVKDAEIYGPDEGDLLIISWGSTYGAIYTALEQINNQRIGWYHLRWINPLPKSLSQYIHNFKRILIPEVNMGQLQKIIRSEYLVDARGLNKVRGLPLSSKEIIQAIEEQLNDLEP